MENLAGNGMALLGVPNLITNLMMRLVFFLHLKVSLLCWFWKECCICALVSPGQNVKIIMLNLHRHIHLCCIKIAIKCLQIQLCQQSSYLCI